MLSCLRDTYFSKLDYVGRKEVVLKEIETFFPIRRSTTGNRYATKCS